MGKTCKDCSDRHLHCHSTCEVYKENRKKLDEVTEVRRKYRSEESFYRSVHSHNRPKGRW